MESFVARHVMIMLYHEGDMDGKDDPRYNGTDESGGFLRMNRRQVWTLGIYIMTLIPALLVSDIGPVMSITGSLGGSCLAYIGPGLVYLGLNGEDFLSMAYGYLEDGKEKMWPHGDGNIALNSPKDESRYNEMTDNVVNIVSTMPKCNNKNKCRPIWWYIGGFPIWCAIANMGSLNTKEKLGDNENNTKSGSSCLSMCGTVFGDENDEIVVTTPREFCNAIFFIVFGLIGAFAGVISNVYMLFPSPSDE